jgi:hypothetical protein
MACGAISDPLILSSISRPGDRGFGRFCPSEYRSIDSSYNSEKQYHAQARLVKKLSVSSSSARRLDPAFGR